MPADFTEAQVEAAAKAAREAHMRSSHGLFTDENWRESALAALRVAEPLAWRPIGEAPLWVGDNEALIGQLNSEGRWVKLTIWDAAWSRDASIHRGATHWRPLPAPPQGGDDAG